MPIIAPDQSQRNAAKVVGIAYLFAMAVSMIAESYIGGRLIVPDDAGETARNIIANQGLFRLGIASSLVIVLSDVALITALYVILKRVNESLALYATFLRLMQTAIYAVATLNYLDVLRVLGDAAYLQPLGTQQAQVFARLSIGSYNAGLGVAFIYLGLGSALHAYLWLKSRYIPRGVAVLGVFASALLGLGSLAIVLLPGIRRIMFPAYMIPMFFFEVGLGVLLLVKGLRPYPAGPTTATSRT